MTETDRYLQANLYRNDLADWYSDETEQQNDSGIPVMVYDEEHLERWQERIQHKDFSDMTIRTLHTVNGGKVPIRWITSVAETAHLIEGFQEQGIKNPDKWKLMAPVNMNTTVNNGDLDEALENADRLALFAKAYVNRFHPTIPVPEVELDNLQAVPQFLKKGRELYPHLSDEIQESLAHMAGNHTNGDVDLEGSAGYLLAHYAAYGLTDGGLFTPRPNTLFVLPQSEGKFLGMMEEAENAVRAIGHTPTTFAEQKSIVTLSHQVKSPHYYPHQGERTLDQLWNVQQWPTRKQLSQNGTNGLARDEISGCLDFIRNDIGGNVSDLVTIVQDTLLKK